MDEILIKTDKKIHLPILWSCLEYFETGSPLLRMLVIENGIEGLLTIFSSFISLFVETKLGLRFAEESTDLLSFVLFTPTEDIEDGIGDEGLLRFAGFELLDV